jgi:trehalose synthase
VRALPIERFRALLGEDYAQVEKAAELGRELFAGRVVWHVNSTAKGGGVVELLSSLLAYSRGAGVDARWVVIGAGPDFFRVTKRIHNNLHGAPGDGGPLGDAERKIYEDALEENADELAATVRKGDVVFLHDPQTAGLVPAMLRAGAHVVWRCHVGLDTPNEHAERAWSFLRRYVEQAEAYVFSRERFVWGGLERSKVWIVHPSIDAFSPKNADMDAATVGAILRVAGLSDAEGSGLPVFSHVDGTPARVDSVAELVQAEPLHGDEPLVAQVSRWDRLKDPVGLLRCFAGFSRGEEHLLLAGPSVESVADDPEGAEVFEEVKAEAKGLPDDVRRRVHLAALPMEDVAENAAIVNAIQRRADVIVQKSLAEGFGLTVSEGMWKSRPVVASKVGGIQDQIVDGESGLLIADPRDLDAFGEAIGGLIGDPGRAQAMGEAARERVRQEFLGSTHLIRYLQLVGELIGRA